MTPPPVFDGQRRRLLGWIIAATLAQAAALAAAAIATRAVFTELHAGTDLPLVPILAVGCAGICAALMQLTFRNYAEHLGQDYAKDIRLTLFEHASRSDQSDLDKRRLGYHVLRFTGDLSALTGWPGLGLPRLVQAAILLPAATAVLIYLDPRFLWAAICAILPGTLWAAATHHKLVAAHRTLRQRRARLAADITERLPIAPKLTALGRRRTELRILEARAAKLIEAARSRRHVTEIRKAIPEVSAAIAASLVMMIGGLGDLPAGTVAAALAALALSIRPLRNVMSSSDRAAGFQAAHDKLKKALNRPIATPENQEAKLPAGPLSVEISPSCGPAISVAPGEVATISADLMDQIEAALTGGANLDEVTLRLNDADVAELTPGSLRRSVGVLTENPLILKGSLRRALTLGLRPRPDDDRIFEAIDNAGLDEVIATIGGLDAKLAERGANLSPQQRLAISTVRLAMQRPGLVLMRSKPLAMADEPACSGATRLQQIAPSLQGALP